MNLQQFALNMLENNPQVINSPRAREMAQIIRSGDQAKGEQLAQNLCNTYGMSKDNAVSQARNFFGLG